MVRRAGPRLRKANMSSRGRNHTRGTMQAWRGMAAEGYHNGLGHHAKPLPQLLRRNARWRPIVRILARQAGWSFTDGYLWTWYGGARGWELFF